jgi:1-acyl-sn-glycerol-3-phosphate acyltransferase
MIGRAWGTLILALGALLLATFCLAWALAAVLLLPLLPAATGRRVGRLGAMYGFRAWLAIMETLGAWRLDLSELDALRGTGPLIVAPNHPGLLDAVFVISRLPDTVCVMKGSLLRNFLLAPAARLARYVPNDSLLRLIARAGGELEQGGQLLLFPEGTRSVGALGPFTDAVAAVSARTRVPVQAVIIEDGARFLGKGWSPLRVPEFPLSYRVRLGRRFEPPSDVRAFTGELERYFARELASGAATAVPDDAIVESAPHLRG